MAIEIDKNAVREIIVMIVERWAGASLDDTQQMVLDEFMEAEIKPLDRLELMRRTSAPAEILKSFLAFSRTRTPWRYCEPLPASDDESVCYAF